MARPKKAVEAPAEAVSEVNVPTEVENDAQRHFEVFDAKGDFVREYTVEASGKDAGEMARVFALEINGKVK